MATEIYLYCYIAAKQQPKRTYAGTLVSTRHVKPGLGPGQFPSQKNKPKVRSGTQLHLHPHPVPSPLPCRPLPWLHPLSPYEASFSSSSSSVRSTGPKLPASPASAGSGFNNRPGILLCALLTGSSGMSSGMRSKLPWRNRIISTYLASVALLDDVIMRPASLKSRSSTAADAGAPNKTRAARARSGYELSHLFHHLSTLSQLKSAVRVPASRPRSVLSSARALSSSEGPCAGVGASGCSSIWCAWSLVCVVCV